MKTKEEYSAIFTTFVETSGNIPTAAVIGAISAMTMAIIEVRDILEGIDRRMGAKAITKKKK